jgi:hypothetical protein
MDMTMLKLSPSRIGIPVVLALVLATAAIAGPPWIAIEYPANPHDPGTRGALFTVRTYHHGELVSYDLTGTAEGLVNGKRQSTPLDIKRLSSPGMYAVRWQKPAQGTWVLVVTSKREGQFAASAVVSIDGAGRVAGVNVPSDPIEGGRWLVPRKVAANEIDAMLRGASAVALRQSK